MSIFSRLFGDPTIAILHGYQKDLLKIKKIEEEYKKTILSVDAVKAKTAEFRARFEPIRLSYLSERDSIELSDASRIQKNAAIEKNNTHYRESRESLVQDIRFEALALHRRACELIYGQELELTPSPDRGGLG